MSSAKKLALGVAAVIAAAVLYWTFGDFQKGAQQKALAGLVADGSAQLKAALAGTPAREHIAAIEADLETLRAARASRQIAMSAAAETYLVSARAIILRKAEVARLAPQAAASRQALAAHMYTQRGRDDSWIRRASELKRKMDQDHTDLDRQLKTLYELLYTLPIATDALKPFVEKSALLDEPVRKAALDQAEADAKRAAEEIDKAGRLPVGR